MLNQAFNEVYTKFKLHFYQEIFQRFQEPGSQSDHGGDLLYGEHPWPWAVPR